MGPGHRVKEQDVFIRQRHDDGPVVMPHAIHLHLRKRWWGGSHTACLRVGVALARSRTPAHAHLLGQPADVVEVAVGAAGTRAQNGVDVCQRLGQQGGDVGVDGREPGVGAGTVLTAQDYRVQVVGRVQLQQPGRETPADSSLSGTFRPKKKKHHLAPHPAFVHPWPPSL